MNTRLLLLGVALAIFLILNFTMAEETTPSTGKPTYMGVDANDKDAVAKRQKELAHEKWEELFGKDADINDLDFSPDLTNPLFNEGAKKLKDSLKGLLGLLKKNPADAFKEFFGRLSKPSTTTTPAPMD